MRVWYFIKLVELCGYRFESELTYGMQMMKDLEYWKISKRHDDITESYVKEEKEEEEKKIKRET